MNIDPIRQADLRRMKFNATAMLAAATLIFILAKIYESVYPWLGFVRATAEAAMVGGIADWFAVTALFRYPLGLKIPHTAIVPTRKDEIGHHLGQFVRDNFLVEPVISERLRTLNVAQTFTRWLTDPANSRQLAEHLAVGLAAVVQTIKDEDIQDLIEQNVVGRVRSSRFAPILANVLHLLSAENRHQKLLYGLLQILGQLIEENKELIQEQIGRELPRLTPTVVHHAIYRWLVQAVYNTRDQVKENPDHPLHEKFCELLTEAIDQLQNSPDIEAREIALKEELLQHPMMQEFSASLWQDLKTALVDYEPDTGSQLPETIQQGVIRFGEALLEDELFLRKINRWLEQIVHYFVREYGHEVAHLIASTIKQWDGDATALKIESYVGKDLQYIRINGTLVGGLVGLIIYSVSLLL